MIEIRVTLWVANSNFPLEKRRLGRFVPDGGDQAVGGEFQFVPPENSNCIVLNVEEELGPSCKQ